MRVKISIADAGFTFNLVHRQGPDDIEIFSLAVALQAKRAAESRLIEIVSQLDQTMPVAVSDEFGDQDRSK
jgi:hypothetical protein